MEDDDAEHAGAAPGRSEARVAVSAAVSAGIIAPFQRGAVCTEGGDPVGRPLMFLWCCSGPGGNERPAIWGVGAFAVDVLFWGCGCGSSDGSPCAW